MASFFHSATMLAPVRRHANSAAGILLDQEMPAGIGRERHRGWRGGDRARETLILASYSAFVSPTAAEGLRLCARDRDRLRRRGPTLMRSARPERDPIACPCRGLIDRSRAGARGSPAGGFPPAGRACAGGMNEHRRVWSGPAAELNPLQGARSPPTSVVAEVDVGSATNIRLCWSHLFVMVMNENRLSGWQGAADGSSRSNYAGK